LASFPQGNWLLSALTHRLRAAFDELAMVWC